MLIKISDDEYVLQIRLGGTPLDIPLTRYDAAVALPEDRIVCYADGGKGVMSAAQYRDGEWLNHRGNPLGFEPVAWFKLGDR